MAKWISILVLLITCTLQGQNQLSSTEQDQLLTEIKVFASETESLSANFSQIKHLDMLEESIESTGHFFNKNTNQLLWEYLSPFEYKIVLNGEKAMIDDGVKKSSYSMNDNPVFESINTMMTGMLNGEIFNSKAFTFVFFHDEENYRVEMKPEEAGMLSYIEEIFIQLSKTNYTVSSIKMIEPGGDYTQINFSESKINEAMDDDLFLLD